MCRSCVDFQVFPTNPYITYYPHDTGVYTFNMMQSISKKLTLSFLGLTLIVLIATLGLARWSFVHGFLDYVNALEQTRLERLASELSDSYRANSGRWDSTTLSTLDDRPNSAEPVPRRKKPKLKPNGERRSRHPEKPGLKPDHSPFQHRPPPHKRRSTPPTALFSANGEQIAGARLSGSSNDHIRVPIISEGKIIGELRTSPRRDLDSPRETAFSKQQLLTSSIIGLTSLSLAALVSWLLSRTLVAPVRRMANSVNELANGNFTTRLQEQRADELGQLMNDLDHLAGILEENRLSRRRWLADISHELRTPVTILSGEIEAIKDGLRTLDKQQILSFDQEVQRLRHLIEDLYQLSLSDVGGLRYEFTSIDICHCLKATIDSVNERALSNGIAIDIQCLDNSIVKADGQRISQLFHNILLNSISYTNSPGKIEISVSRDSQQLTVTVQDSAPGLNEQDCQKIFEPLYRHEASRSRRAGGAGLGLTICQNIVKAHGGTISAQPSALGGLSISIAIPHQTTIPNAT